MKRLTALFVMSLLAGYANAQDTYYEQGIDAGLQAEIERESGEWPGDKKKKRRRGERVEVEEDFYAEPQRVIIHNNQQADQSSYQSSATGVQQQPTTYVEASPLADSRAEQLRKARQNAEVKTEQMIVEKLEESRLKDEKRRANRLFGDRLEESAPTSPTYGASQPAPQPAVQQVAPTVVAAPEAEVEEMDEPLKVEVINSSTETTSEDEDDFSPLKNSLYVSGLLGMAEYSDVDNVQGNWATGFSVGSIVSDNLMVEGSFVYSNYYIDEYWQYNFFKEMDQYNFSVAAKAFLPAGRLRPWVGAVGSYVRRSYSDRTYDYDPYGYSYGDEYAGDNTTNAFDLGLTAGADFDIADGFTLGAGFTYMFNMINKSESFLQERGYYSRGYRSYNAAPANTVPVEELDYYMFTVSGKVRF